MKILISQNTQTCNNNTRKTLIGMFGLPQLRLAWLLTINYLDLTEYNLGPLFTEHLLFHVMINFFYFALFLKEITLLLFKESNIFIFKN